MNPQKAVATERACQPTMSSTPPPISSAMVSTSNALAAGNPTPLMNAAVPAKPPILATPDSMKSCASRMRAASGAYVFTNSHNAFIESPCGAPATSLAPAAKYNCRGNLCRAKGALKSFDLVTGCAPRIEAAGQRAYADEAPVHQHAGDTRRAGFVRSRTVNDDVAVGRQLRHVLVKVMEVDGNG